MTSQIASSLLFPMQERFFHIVYGKNHFPQNKNIFLAEREKVFLAEREKVFLANILTTEYPSSSINLRIRLHGCTNIAYQSLYFVIRQACRIFLFIGRYFLLLGITFGCLFSDSCRKNFSASLIRLMSTFTRLSFAKFQIALAIVGSATQIIFPSYGLRILQTCHEIDIQFDTFESKQLENQNTDDTNFSLIPVT